MTIIPKSKFAAWAVAGLVLAGALSVGSPALAAAKSADLRDQRRKRIEAMSEHDRARLDRNFKQFLKLPKDEQDRLRALNAELKVDDRDKGELRRTLDDYYRWLATLTPFQKEDLRAEADPNKREILVRNLLKEQQEVPDQPAAPRRGLSPRDLDAVLGILERAMLAVPGGIPASKQKELQEKTGLAKHVLVFGLAFPAERKQGQPAWVAPGIFKELADSISDKKQQNFIRPKAGADEKDRPLVVWRLVGLIYAGIEAEYQDIRPDEESLQKFFVELKGVQQDEVMRQSPDRMMQHLTRLYMEAHADEYPPPPRFPNWLRQRAGGGNRPFLNPRGPEGGGPPPRKGGNPPGTSKPQA